MLSTVQILILLLVVQAAVAVLAARLAIPSAILLVIVGVILALIPGLPAIELDPELVLLLVLPPILYTSAVAMSWSEFRFNLRPITLLAFGCVMFTTAAIAAAAHWLLGLPWPVSFVLGAIVSPPDAVAPLAIARRLKVPRRILVVLEGEGLVNDATALVLYRFAVATVSVGVFSFSEAAGLFAVIVAGEIVWGIGVGWLMLRLRRWVNNPSIEIILSVLTPFLAYWPSEYLGGSGVLATVAAGLYISWNGPQLISAATRLQGVFFWNFFIYLIEGMVFLLTGLQVHTLLLRIGHYPLAELLVSAAIISLVVVVSRFVWMYPATYLPRWLFPAIRRKDPSPPWQFPFALAFTGVRGIVSLAAALAIPLTTASGQPFPHRDLILFLTFCVIVITLVAQGLLLPFVIRALGLAHAGHRESQANRVQEQQARRLAIEAVLARLEQFKSDAALGEKVLEPLRLHYADRLRRNKHQSDGDDEHRKLAEAQEEISLRLIETEREQINELFRAGKLKDEARRKIERELDLREAEIRNQQTEG
jgi:monovalent cation/hydrogen antiporter